MNSTKTTWNGYIASLNEKPHADRTKEENFMILYADLISQYEGIKKPSDITDEIRKHYRDIKDKELTQMHREILMLSDEDIDLDYKDPCRPTKLFLREKGDVIHKLCKILGIKKHLNFHLQIQEMEIYEEDLLNSEWYFHVIRYQKEIQEIFPHIRVDPDFKKNPLKFFKTFCFKVMGISCELKQRGAFVVDDHEQLLKQYKKDDIYKRNAPYGLGLEKTPTSNREKRKCAEQWIQKKIENGEQLTRHERTLKSLKKHVKINKAQPRWNGYISGYSNSLLLKIEQRYKKEKTHEYRRHVR